jgi:hypothetical protein
LNVYIPAQTPVARYPDAALGVFRIGTLCLCSTVLTLTNPPSFGYRYGASKADPRINRMLDGGQERVGMGNTRIWRGSFGINAMSTSYESEIWQLDNMFSMSDYMVFSENMGVQDRSYLCYRDRSFDMTWIDRGVVSVSQYDMVEVV